MEGADYYINDAEYMDEVLDWIKEWICLYKKYAVLQDENGRLKQIKGSIVFGTDLELSLEGRMTVETKSRYEAEAAKLREKPELFEKKAGYSFGRGTAVPLEYLFRVFGLTAAERFVVCMSASVEYDRTFGRMFSLLQDDYKEIYPTMDLCLKIYTPYEQERLACRSALLSEKSRLKYFFQSPPEKISGPLILHPRILQFLSDFEEGDRELEGITELRFPDGRTLEQGESKISLQEKLSRAAWRNGSVNICFIYGPDGAGKKTLVSGVSAVRRPVLFIDTKRLYHDRTKLEQLLVNIARELIIRAAVPCFCHFEILQCREDDPEETIRNKESITQKIINRMKRETACLFLTSDRQWEGSCNWEGIVWTDWEVPFPTGTEQIRIWEEFMGDFPESDISPEALSVRFSLTPGQMTEALKRAVDKNAAEGHKKLTREELYRACRRQLTMHLGNNVTRVQTHYRWEDLVLPERQKKALESACNQVEYNHQVYELWGFDEKVAYGKGVSMLFYGPPGTGKTMGAQVIANQLSMELYKVDLSSVMSKYIGETEKNLGKIFDEVKKSRSILFFDEADALFGKRTEVKDAHDKYANAETAYLLQKIEEYQGIVVLATNYMQNFDEAFKRRIKFVIEFPFPSARYRQQMGLRVFPKKTPLEELDYEYLAEQFELSGSSIKNIAVAAAFLAAAGNVKVGMRQILSALKDEMIKSGKSMPPENFGEYYGLISDCY